MDKLFFIMGSSFAALSVAFGAFGAHGLRRLVSSEMLANWETASRYQMYYALALLLVAWAWGHWGHQAKLLEAGGWLFVVGIGLFSGSLYLMTLSGLKWLGAITPLGGIAFVVGWLCLLAAVWRA